MILAYIDVICDFTHVFSVYTDVICDLCILAIGVAYFVAYFRFLGFVAYFVTYTSV